MTNSPKYSNGVNQAGKAYHDTEVKVRYKKTTKNPFTLFMTGLLNSFGAMVSPIKIKDKNKH